MKLNSRLKIAFIAFVVLGVYYPALFGGVNLIDDSRLLASLGDAGKVTLRDIFLPGGSHYYRPLVMLSFYIDKYLWALEPSFMHLENVLIHALNAVLVFLAAKRIFARFADERLELPLLSALLFALHPINTEAVDWIAGRTDPLATLFVLLSLVVFERALDGWRIGRFYLAAGMLFCGYLVKEVALFFLPAVFLMVLFADRRESRIADTGAISSSAKVRALLPFLIVTVAYFALRMIGLAADDTSMGILMRESSQGILPMAASYLKPLGFYVKKLVFPLPLNFAIAHYSENYVWLGIVTLCLAVFALARRHIVAVLFLGSLFFITPALLVAVKKIAWTPVAERYLYLSSAFFVMSAVAACHLLLRRVRKESFLPPALMLLLLPTTYATTGRNIVWQDNLTLYADTVKKSPDFARIRNELGCALMEKGRLDEANRQFEIGRQGDRNNYLIYLNQASISMMNGDYAKAKEIVHRTYGHKSGANEEVLKMLARIDERSLFAKQDKRTRMAAMNDLIDTYHYLYLKTNDALFLYRAGQLCLFVDRRDQAAELFAAAARTAAPDACYKKAAEKLAISVKLK